MIEVNFRSIRHEYDDNGNLTNDGVYKYTYDAENRLIDIDTFIDDEVTAYTCDSFGRRMSKYIEETGITTTYVYDGPHVIAEYEDDGSGPELARTFIYGPGIDEPIAMIVLTGDNQGIYFYYYDGLGSVTALSNTDGDIVEGYTYDAFGNVVIHTDDGPDDIWLNGDTGTTYNTIGGSSFGNPYMFTGRRLDAETRNTIVGKEGLYYYRARMYNPKLGRFMQTDALGYYDSMNLYQYCANNPVNWFDPWGLKTVVIDFILFGETNGINVEEIQDEIQKLMDQCQGNEDKIRVRVRKAPKCKNPSDYSYGTRKAYRAVPSKNAEKGDVLRYTFCIKVVPGSSKTTGHEGENSATARKGNIGLFNSAKEDWTRFLVHEGLYHGLCGHSDRFQAGKTKTGWDASKSEGPLKNLNDEAIQDIRENLTVR